MMRTMIRLLKIELVGFRGALDGLSIDLESSGRSIAIFGENAAGKSSISDAIEWFYKDRVDHLWKENCKESALRNTFLPEKSDSSVFLAFTDKTLDCRKTLSSLLTTSVSNRDKRFEEYLGKTNDRPERLTLRTGELLSFILSTKTEKRQLLAKIIGYEALDDFREVLSQTQSKLEGTPEFVAASQNSPQYQKDIFKIAGQPLGNATELYEVGQQIAAKVGVSSQIVDDSSYAAVIDEISAKIGDKERAKKQLALSQTQTNCKTFRQRAKDALEKYESFTAVYGKLIESEEEIKQLRVEGFLSQGKSLIDHVTTTPDICPFCLQPKSWDFLKRELQSRIDKFKEIKDKYDAALTEKNGALASLGECVRSGKQLRESATIVGLEEEFKSEIDNHNLVAGNVENKIRTDFDKYKAISGDFKEVTNRTTTIVEQKELDLTNQIQALELSQDEQKFLDAVRNLENMKTSFHKYRTAADTVAKFDRQIRALAAIRSKFVTVHSRTLQDVLNVLSADISRYYMAMHPQENVDEIKLIILEEGVEFEYAFNGKRVYPPLKYLSESHLNSLGIAAFLASAKLFNKTNQFFVLDDVVTSFDSNHRIRLLRLLENEFADWQILLLTHDAFWFQVIRKELQPKGWLVNEIEMLPGSHIQMKSSSRGIMEEIVRKKKDGTLSPNDLRNALEKMLKDICHSLEVKLAFRYNDQNERRMPGEMLSDIRATLKRKSAATLKNEIFARLEASSLIATTGSHDSGPVLSSGDITVCYEDILALDALFCCEHCQKYVSVERLVEHEKRLYCKCGATHLEWGK
jgi:ABC-type Mn2+/Zn2+ transport system ATPase subunit